MTMRFAALAGLLVTAFADEVQPAHADSASADVSVAQIQETLKSLQRSVEDSSRDLERFADTRQRWCDESLRSFVDAEDVMNTSLRHLAADIEEHGAAVDEAAGTAQQLQADVALIQHTLDKTKEALDDWRREKQEEEQAFNSTDLSEKRRDELQKQFEEDEAMLVALVKNKRQTLLSAQGEQTVFWPVITQLKAQLVEMQRRHADKDDSTTSSQQFVWSVRNGCSHGARRSDEQAAGASAALGPVSTALQALAQLSQGIGNAVANGGNGATPASPEQRQVPSFLQTAQEPAAQAEDDDLLDVFSGPPEGQDDTAPPQQSDAPVATPAPEAQPSSLVAASQQDEDADDTSATDDDSAQDDSPQDMTDNSHAAATQSENVEQAQAPVPARHKIEELLSELRTEPNTGEEGREWCEEEAERSSQVVMLAQASIREMEAEMDVHADSVETLDRELAILHATRTSLESAAEQAANSSAREHTMLSAGARDHPLAAKIVEQAMAILAGLKEYGGLAPTAAKDADDALAALKAARTAFQAQTAAVHRLSAEVNANAVEIAKLAEDAVGALERERVNLELARDTHAGDRAHSAENRRVSEAELKKAVVYADQLRDACQSNVSSLEDTDRQAAIQALEDSKMVLDGRRPSTLRGASTFAANSVPGLPGATAPKDLPANLSPLERAAAELGVPVDDSSSNTTV